MSKNIFSSVHNCTLYTKSMRRRIANFEYFWKGIVSVSYVSRNATEIGKKKVHYLYLLKLGELRII